MSRLAKYDVIELEHFNRAITLLKATYSLLKKQDCSCYVLNLLSETVFYDEAECDGNCLMEDIDALLFEVERRTDEQVQRL